MTLRTQVTEQEREGRGTCNSRITFKVTVPAGNVPLKQDCYQGTTLLL